MYNDIDTKRLEAILVGTEDPETIDEEIFLTTYTNASQGVTLQSSILALGAEFDDKYNSQLLMVLIGYGMGQLDYIENKALNGELPNMNKH